MNYLFNEELYLANGRPTFPLRQRLLINLVQIALRLPSIDFFSPDFAAITQQYDLDPRTSRGAWHGKKLQRPTVKMFTEVLASRQLDLSAEISELLRRIFRHLDSLDIYLLKRIEENKKNEAVAEELNDIASISASGEADCAWNDDIFSSETVTLKSGEQLHGILARNFLSSLDSLDADLARARYCAPPDTATLNSRVQLQEICIDWKPWLSSPLPEEDFARVHYPASTDTGTLNYLVKLGSQLFGSDEFVSQLWGIDLGAALSCHLAMGPEYAWQGIDCSFKSNEDNLIHMMAASKLLWRSDIDISQRSLEIAWFGVWQEEETTRALHHYDQWEMEKLNFSGLHQARIMYAKSLAYLGVTREELHQFIENIELGI